MPVEAAAFTVFPPPGMAWHNWSKPELPVQSLSIPRPLRALAPRLVTAPPTLPQRSFLLSSKGSTAESLPASEFAFSVSPSPGMTWSIPTALRACPPMSSKEPIAEWMPASAVAFSVSPPPGMTWSIPTALRAWPPMSVTTPPMSPKRSFLFPNKELIAVLMPVEAAAFTVFPPPGMAWHNWSKPELPVQSLSIPRPLRALAPRLVTAPPTLPQRSFLLSLRAWAWPGEKSNRHMPIVIAPVLMTEIVLDLLVVILIERDWRGKRLRCSYW